MPTLPEISSPQGRLDTGSAFSASSVLPLVIIVVVALAIHFITPLVGSYAERILIDMAIAMIAAVSLNIVNGFTGQFSIGHAAFMALGGYMAAWISYYLSLTIWKTTYIEAPSWIALLHAQPSADFGQVARAAVQGIIGRPQWLLVGAALCGGLLAAAAGWVVGLPSLRLKGDYLAIVTLGFGEILRVIIQQTNPQALSYEELKLRPLFGDAGWVLPPGVGGALGFTDIPK